MIPRPYQENPVELSSVIAPYLLKTLSLPFNTLTLLSTITESQNVSTLKDLRRNSFDIISKSPHQLQVDVYGSHCYGLCQYLLSLLSKNLSIQGYICPSWYESESRENLGHVAIVIPYSYNDQTGYILLDPGLNISTPVIIPTSTPVQISSFHFSWTESQLIRATRQPSDSKKPNFLYDFLHPFESSDSWPLLRSMLSRQQFSLYFRSVPNLRTKEYLLGIDLNEKEPFIYCDHDVAVYDGIVSSNTSRIDRCAQYPIFSQTNPKALLSTITNPIHMLTGDDTSDLVSFLTQLFQSTSITRIMSLRKTIQLLLPTALNSPHISLSNEQIRKFNDDGYILLKSVIPIEMINMCLSEINIMLSKSLIEGIADDKYISSTSENRFSTGKLIYNVDSQTIWSLLSETPLHSYAQSLFGDNELIRPETAQLAIRFPLSTSENSTIEERNQLMSKELSRDHWHIDGQWESNIPQFSLLVGVYLTPCPASGYGNFTAFPGSHRRVQAMLAEDFEGFCSQLRTKVAPNLNTPQDRPPVEVVVNPGDVLLAHPLLAHRAGENWSSQVRHAVYFRLNTTTFTTETKKAMITNLYCEMPPLIREIEKETTSSCIPQYPSWLKMRAPTQLTRTFLVTGANRGIGLATSIQLIQDAILQSESIFLFIGCRSYDKLQSTFDAIYTQLVTTGTHINIPDSYDRIGLCGLIIDLSVKSTIVSAITTLEELSPQGINCLVNNAAVRLRSNSSTLISQEIDINFFGTLELTLALVPLLSKACSTVSGSRILNITSIGGEAFFKQLSCELQTCVHLSCNEDSVISLMNSFKDYVHSRPKSLDWGTQLDGYCCSKMGLNALTRIWAEKYRSIGIHVIAIDPGKCCTSSIGPSSGSSSGSPPHVGAMQIMELLQLHPPVPIVKNWKELSGKLWWKSQITPWYEPTMTWDGLTHKPLWISLCGVGGCGKTTFLNSIRQNTNLARKLIISELSIIDYIYCNGDAQIFLSQDQQTKDSLHLQGLQWLEREFYQKNKIILFSTHGSVIINKIPTIIIKSRDLEHVSDLIYLDYDLETVMRRQEGDQIRKRNHPRTRVKDWILLEKKCIEEIKIQYPWIRIHTLHPEDDLMETFLSILQLSPSAATTSAYLPPIKTIKCGEIPSTRKQCYPHLIDIQNDPHVIDGAITICRCGRCQNFPYAEDTCQFPLVATSEKYGRHLKICGCGRSRGRLCGRPWCDGSHTFIHDIEDLPPPCPRSSPSSSSPGSSPSQICQQNNLPSEMYLTEKQRDQFMSEGYCILKNILPSHLTQLAIKAINMALSQALVSNTYPPDFVNTTMRPTSGKKLFKTTSIDILNLLIPILPICNHLLGVDSFYLPSECQVALRFPTTGGQPKENYFEDSIEWHVDDIFDSPLPPFSLLIGIPLNDWKETWCGNFTLYRGSHHTLNRMILDDYQSFVDNYKFPKHPKLPNPLQILVNINDAFLVHPLVAHQVAPNYSPCVRYAVYFRIETKYKLFLQRRILSDIWLEFPGIRHDKTSQVRKFLLRLAGDIQHQFPDFPNSERILELCELLSNLFMNKEERILLSKYEGIDDLDLSSMDLGDGGMILVSHTLQLNPPLKSLRLECNHIGDKGAEYLASSLLSNTNLTKLDLFDNNIGSAGAQALAKALQSHPSKCLRMLDLWGNQVTNDGGISLVKVMAFGSQPGLHDLLLNANSLNHEIIPVLREIFMQKESIAPSKLYIEDCKLGNLEHIMSYSHGQAILNSSTPLVFTEFIQFGDQKTVCNPSIEIASPSLVTSNTRDLDQDFALSDTEIQRFICDGLHVIQDELTSEMRSVIISRLDLMYSGTGNAGNNVVPLIPELGFIWSSPIVRSAVTSLLGNNWIVHPHRHSHLGLVNRPPQTWHRDSTFGYRLQRLPYPTYLLAFYYPHDVTEDCGPTEILLGSQYYHRPEGERLCRLPHRYLEKYQNEWQVDQYSIVPCAAGTIALVHPDIWHRGGRNLSGILGDGKRRHMVKFILERREFPTHPTWNFQSPEFSPPQQLGRNLRFELWRNVWDWMRGDTFKISAPLPSSEQVELLEEQLHSASVALQLKSASVLASKEQGFHFLTEAFLQDGFPYRRGDIFDQSFHGILQSSDPHFLRWIIDLLRTPPPCDVNKQEIWIQRIDSVLLLLGLKLPHYASNQTGIIMRDDLETAISLLLHYLTCSVPRLRLSAVRAIGWQQWILSCATVTTINHLLTALSHCISTITESYEYIQTYATSALSKLLLFLPSHYLTQSSIITTLLFPTLRTLLTSSPIISYSHRYTIAYAIESLSLLAIHDPVLNEFLVNYLKLSRWCPYTHPKSSY